MNDLEPLSEERLAEIRRHHDAYSKHPYVGIPACCSAHASADTVPELLAEVMRQRAEIARGNQEIELLNSELAAEREQHRDTTNSEADAWAELAELQKRIGNATTKWGMQHPLEDDVRTWRTEEETRKYGGRLAQFDPDWKLVTCVVGEWKAADI